MNSSAKKELYNTNRRERQSKVRQAVLINEYVYTKYFAIYREAAQYYNELNALYPTKRDLRKCQEFRKWKRDTSGLIVQPESPDRPVQHQISNTRRNTRYHIFYHSNIPLEQQQLEVPVQSESPIEQHLEVPVQSESPIEQHLEVPVQPESPIEQHLEVPVQPESPTEQHLEVPVQTESPTQQHLEVPVQTESPTQQHLEVPVKPTNPVGKKIMELKIPLLKRSVVTETLQVVTQETIQEENPLQVAAEETVQDFTTIYPTLEEELPQDIIDHIINELREDPELKTIMTDIEQDLEFERLGMEVDIPEDDRLENELENMTLW